MRDIAGVAGTVMLAAQDIDGMAEMAVGQGAGVEEEEQAAADQQYDQGQAPEEIGNRLKNRFDRFQALPPLASYHQLLSVFPASKPS